MRICTKSAQCTKLDGHGGLHGTWNAELGEYVPLESGAAENAHPASTHRNLADHFASVPRHVGGPIPQAAPEASALEYWARDVAEYLGSDKSNDWSEELDRLADILGDDDLRAER